MPESRGDFILLQTIEPVEEGEIYRKIPPHVTVLSWFTINRALINEVRPVLDQLVAQYGHKAGRGIGANRVLFGANEDIPACEIDVPVFEIHDEVMEWVDANGGAFKFEKFARELHPHVTDEEGVSIQPDEPVNFSTLALFSIHNAAAKLKRADYVAELGGAHEATP